MSAKTRFLLWPAWISLVPLALSGCATMGPLDPVRAELQAKALQFRYQQLLRIEGVGHQLLTHLPEPAEGKLPGLEPAIKPRPYSGLVLADVDAAHARAFSLDPEAKGVVIAGVVPTSPAAQAGFQAGDVVTTIAGTAIRNARDASQRLAQQAPATVVAVDITRQGIPWSSDVALGAVPLPITFAVAESEKINASMDVSGTLTVTYGLLRFVSSDDELAVVLGHELAHLTKGHMTQNLGTAIMASVIGGIVGGALGAAIPGAAQPMGQAVARGVQAGYSQDRELEADAVGLAYVQAAGFNPGAGPRLWERFAVELPSSMTQDYLGTHPASPERMTQLRMEAERLTGLPLEALQALPSATAPPVAPVTPLIRRPFLSRHIDALLKEVS